MSLHSFWKRSAVDSVPGQRAAGTVAQEGAARGPVVCPYCLAGTAVDGPDAKCKVCEKRLPPLYLEAPGPAPALPIQVFGLSEHGKSAYLAALTMVLRDMIAVWPGCICTPATQASQTKVREINQYRATGTMPPLTQLGRDECYLMLIRNSIPWGKRALMIRDCSGEAFGTLEVSLDEARFLIRSPITFMFYSLADTHLLPGFSFDMLMDNYLNTLLLHGERFERGHRRIVVVLTKADLLVDRLPEPLLAYLKSDPIWPLITQGVRHEHRLDGPAVDEYVKIMRKASKAIETWIGSTIPGATLLSLARVRQIEIRFALVSSTGGQVGTDNRMAVPWEPCRVLDPLFCALDMGQPAISL
jgi:hypothetical protein